MILIFKKLAANRNLLKNLVLRDLKHRYVGSIGGFLWSVIHPLVLLIGYTWFSVVLRMKLGSDAGTDSFPLFLFCGFLPWILFAETVTRNCSSITDNAPLITKTVIPAEILPISITISNLIHHLIGVTILLVVMMIFYGIHLSVLWILLYMSILLLFAQGIGWIVAGLHVFLRDTIQAVQILMFLWMCFTPIFYSANSVPQEFRFAYNLNPMVLIVTGYRNSLLHQSQPSPLDIGIVLVSSLTVFIVGALLFRQAKPAFADVL